MKKEGRSENFSFFSGNFWIHIYFFSVTFVLFHFGSTFRFRLSVHPASCSLFSLKRSFFGGLDLWSCFDEIGVRLD